MTVVSFISYFSYPRDIRASIFILLTFKPTRPTVQAAFTYISILSFRSQQTQHARKLTLSDKSFGENLMLLFNV